MSLQRTVALALSVALTAGAGSVLAQAAAQGQAVGQISGKATDEAKKPYADYAVQLRDALTGQLVSTVPLNQEGRFSFSELPLTKRYLVELFQVKQNKIVCTEGPYALTPPARISKTDVNINCGTNPAMYWLVIASAGTAAAVALGVRSAKQ